MDKKKSMKIQYLIKAGIFSFIFIIGLVGIGKLFTPDYSSTTSNSKSFQKSQDYNVDVMFFGASSYLRGCSPITLYKDKGITSWVMSSVSQPTHVTYYYLKESLKIQQPKVVVIWPRNLLKDYDMDEREAAIRTAVDNRAFSLEKMEMAQETVSGSKTQSLLSYAFPLLRFHSRWADISQNGRGKKEVLGRKAKGQLYLFKTEEVDPLLSTKERERRQDVKVSSWSAGYYDKMINLCRENGTEVVFYVPPRADWDYSQYLAIKGFADKRQVDFIDFNSANNLEKLNLDYNKGGDFADPNHLGCSGAMKSTMLLGDYLTEQYDFSDKRGNPAVEQSYDKAWNIFVQQLKERDREDVISELGLQN